ncbi:O-fucosyltransferase family protein [Brytella acorum]|uniref:O-fucosyltransferase family protein n=1 Tax=Brytella acorum TaxID=2959299 RepID=UPI0025AE9C07|nr:O-fucosyltransferase family protein [Brytella acorum]MDF3626272.1 O-fucosyltransferase family protein [Brytella acorum]
MSSEKTHTTQPISYDGIDLGITNQKIAFIGLAHKAFRERRPLCFPPLVIYDLSTDVRDRIDFFEVFKKEPLLKVLESFSISVSFFGNGLYETVDGWQCFLEGADRFGEVLYYGDVSLDDLTCSIVRALELTEDYYNLTNYIKNSLRNSGVNCTIQMRIEKDWEGYSSNILNSISNERNLPTAKEILDKIKHKFDSSLTSAFVLCDENAMPLSKSEIRRIALENYGINLFWKSDFLDFGKYNPLILSLVDFEIGMSSPIFIGTSRSTFSCFVTFEKYCKNREYVRNHYIYNDNNSDIQERHDNGTSVNAEKALGRTWLRPDLLNKNDNYLSFPMVISAHVSNLGEYISRTSMVRGVVNSKLVAGDCTKKDLHHIEGFEISVSESAPRVIYKTFDIHRVESKWSNDGDYSGSKGKSLPLSGFCIMIEGPASLTLDCIYAAIFSDHDNIVVASNGDECKSISGKGKLLCMQIAFKKNNTTRFC